MVEHNIVFSVFLIFAGAAVLSTFALLTRQSMLVAYMLLGILLGPFGLKLIGDTELVKAVSDVGIIFLLFLLGLNLPPQKLLFMFKKITWVALISSIIFAAIGYLVGWLSGYTTIECLVIGAAMMFSSTIIGIKLLPTTILHHQHTGEVMISVLLLQDLIAIAVLLLMHGSSGGGAVWSDVSLVVLGFPAILIFAYLVERFILLRLFSRFNRIKEYMFLIAIAWCLTMAQLASLLGLSAEIGAFIAGVSLATSPVSVYIAESLKPVRDFFLVMFFFSVGAAFDLQYLPMVIIPAIILMVVLLAVKPVTYRYLLGWVGESKQVSWEVGVRLAQVSEFSLIIAYVGLSTHIIGNSAAYLIEATTILSFMVSSYWVVMKYPTPVAMSDRLRRD
ncbi:cation:proton antiporter [Candidiatus Paracoxiella cheracis]|uniref:cation:proton antiporter n=1 Tax=Candidiatus Paracoxiella cheracis TaxID=3405120 RepID=UPI003BF52B4E